MGKVIDKKSTKIKTTGVSRVTSGEYALKNSTTKHIWNMVELDEQNWLAFLFAIMVSVPSLILFALMTSFPPILLFVFGIAPLAGIGIFSLHDGLRNAKPGVAKDLNWRTSVNGEMVTSNGNGLFSHRTRGGMIVESGNYLNKNEILRVSDKILFGRVVHQKVEVYEKRTAVWDEAVGRLLEASTHGTKEVSNGE